MKNFVSYRYIKLAGVSEQGEESPAMYGVCVWDTSDTEIIADWNDHAQLLNDLAPSKILAYLQDNEFLQVTFWEEIIRTGGLYYVSDMNRPSEWYSLEQLGYPQHI